MSLFSSAKAFGPVPSRRLGMSMGINNIPAKACTYACIYCQVGRTMLLTRNRCEFYEPEKIYKAVQKRVVKALESGIKTDYLTFVPDGEPTLDVNLGKTIDLLKPLGIPIRPPLEKWVHRPDEDRLNRAFQIYSERLPKVEYLIKPDSMYRY